MGFCVIDNHIKIHNNYLQNIDMTSQNMGITNWPQVQ